jgi:hypothetical protein
MRIGPRRGMDRRTMAANLPVVSIRALCLASTSARAIRREHRSSPY